MASRCCRLTSRYCRIAGVGAAPGELNVDGEAGVVTAKNGRAHARVIAEPTSSKYNIGPMLVLALDTATRAGSVALVRDGAAAAMAGDGTRTHGERLPAELLDFLAHHGATLADV